MSAVLFIQSLRVKKMCYSPNLTSFDRPNVSGMSELADVYQMPFSPS